MKKLFSIMLAAVILLALPSLPPVWADEAPIVFEDANFEARIRYRLDKPDGAIYPADVANITDLNVSTYISRPMEANAAGVNADNTDNPKIKSLKGIEYFTSLVNLSCSSNLLTELDLSANTKLKLLYCGGNKIEKLDFSANTELEWLFCGANQLTELDLSANIKLTHLSCGGNQLTALDLTSNLKIVELECPYNQLTSLIIPPNETLSLIHCENNELEILNLFENKVLEQLYCSDNRLKSINITNSPWLGVVECHNNQLQTLDFINIRADMKSLVVSYNENKYVRFKEAEGFQMINQKNNVLYLRATSKNIYMEIEYGDYMVGDANNDESVGIEDARLVLQWIVGKIGDDQLNLEAADVNGDGTVTVDDARLMLQYLTGKIGYFVG
ncbi:MAG: dockerin type I domain-containing protein [Oscillospiraceae bacterium]|nr:dockerin type I domain-containing protein [Oscillospiraceae bacterium]